MKKLLFILFFIIPSISFAQSDSIGVYVQNEKTIYQIEPIKSSGYKTNTLGTALSMGIASSTMKVIFKGSSSSNKVKREDSFYFFYNPNIGNNAALLMKYYMFTTGTSPGSDFSLVKFTQKKNTRELKTGSVNVYSGVNINTQANTDAKFIVNKINETKYKVTLNNIEPGEYCFMYNGINGSGAYMPVFDFSIE